MRAIGHIEGIHVGCIERLDHTGRGGRRLMTAFRKTGVSGPVAVGFLGLAGDVQANRRYHGGPEKAVYAYPLAGYDGWCADFPDLAARFGAGAMGENLVIGGDDEASICIGDTIRCGTATLQVAQIREPCSTLAAVFGTPRVVRTMVKTGRCGWYCRVIEEGVISPGDSHDVIERPNPEWTIARFAQLVAGKPRDAGAWQQLVALPGLAPHWQSEATKVMAAAARVSPGAA